MHRRSSRASWREKVRESTMCDLTVTDLSYAVTSAFYCGKLVLASSTYDGGLFPPMKEFLEHLQTKGFQKPPGRPYGKRLLGTCSPRG